MAGHAATMRGFLERAAGQGRHDAAWFDAIAAALAAPPPPPLPPGKRTGENIRQKTYLGTSAPSPGGKGGAPALGASPADGSPTGQFEDF